MSTRCLQILLVEDNPGDAELLREGLEMLEAPADIAHVSRMAEAEDYLKRESSPDVVLLDLGLPETQGLATLERARRIAPHLPIIVLSGLEDEPTALEAVRKGAQDYQVKGQVQPRVLWRAIHHAVDRKRLEESLLRAKREWERTFDSVPDLIAILDNGQRIVRANRAMAGRLGMTPEQCIGLSCFSCVHGASHPLESCPHTLTVRDGQEHSAEVQEQRLGGTFLVTTTPFFDEQGRMIGTVHVARDITERKRAEEALKAAKDSAERAMAVAEQANRAKDHFLAVLSHELRTPLTPVVMGVSMLQDRPDLDPEVRETLEMVRRHVQMEARLIDDLLDVSRIAQGKIELQKQRVELGTVIQRAVEVCKPDIEARRLHFGVDLGPAAPYWVEADVSRLQQVFWNLLKNAIKFTPHDGCIGIRVRKDEAPAQRVGGRMKDEEEMRDEGLAMSDEGYMQNASLTAAFPHPDPLPGGEGAISAPSSFIPHPSSFVLVEVNDSGIGIESEALTRVFNAFEQAERSVTRQFGGLGLGLAISKALVEMHGGKIEAQSAGRDKGATFRIRLPLTAPIAQAKASPRAAPAQQAVRPLRVLLVEDHSVTAKMMRMVLSADGHTVETAGDVTTALELARQQEFDLLLSDLGLPDGSGHDLMRQLRERGHKFPGIALSGYGQEEDIRRSREAGFAAHLTKPASREAIVDAVASVSAGKLTAAGDDAATTSPPRAPVFDAHAALGQCLGDHDMLDEMRRIFFDDVNKLLPQVQSALKLGNLARAGDLGHRMKGTISYLGAGPAKEAAARVERVAQCGVQAEAEEAVRTLERECQLLSAALANYQAAATGTQHD